MILQTVEFLVSGRSGDFTFNPDQILEWVGVEQCDEGCCWLLTIKGVTQSFPEDWLGEAFVFLN
jgi:hypothetical protein